MRRLGDGRLRRFPHVEYFSAAMAPAGDLGDRRHHRKPRTSLPWFVQRREPAVGVGLQETFEVREMGGRVFAAAVGTVEVDRRRRCGTAERPVVADIDPQSPGPGSAQTGLQHRHRRVVAVDLLGGKRVTADSLDDWLQQPDRLPDPIAQCRAVEVEALGRRSRSADRAADDRYISTPAHAPACRGQHNRAVSAVPVPVPG